ncbi:MAG: hypothetical protein RR482_01460, partial [Clostridia bacterium]
CNEMNADAILARIDEEARNAASVSLHEAQQRAEEMRNASEARIDGMRKAALAQAQRDAVEMNDRMRRMAALEERKALLAAKREIMDCAFDEALHRMQKMENAQAQAYVLRILHQVAQGDEAIAVGKPMPAWADQAFLDQVNAQMRATGRPGTMHWAEEQRAIKSGFLLLSKGMELNCTFEAMLHVQRMSLEAEVATLLFS